MCREGQGLSHYLPDVKVDECLKSGIVVHRVG